MDRLITIGHPPYGRALIIHYHHIESTLYKFTDIFTL
jgi:hypothetical protein